MPSLSGFKAGELPQHLQTVQSLEFRSVSFSYPTNPEKRILDQLSFQVWSQCSLDLFLQGVSMGV